MVTEKKTFPFRVGLVMLGIGLWSMVVAGRLVQLQLIQNEEYTEEIVDQSVFTETVPAHRGEILDAKGRILAISRTEHKLVADPALIQDPKAVASTLAQLLGKSAKWRQDAYKRLSNKDSRYAPLAKELNDAEAAAVRSLGERGLFLEKEIRRKYPSRWLASHVLGFVSYDGTFKEGLERLYDDVLSGRPGEREILRDGKGKRMGLGAVIREGRNGSDLRLTLDANIQFFVENALARAAKATKAANLTAIVMDPRDGRILALANMPDFDPNRYSRYSAFERKNRAVVDVYEPASAFKIITVAAALDTHSVTLDQTYYCNKEKGGIQVADKFIRDHKPFGTLSVSEVLWYSSNVGAIKVAQTMDEPTFADYIGRFGFGQKTDIDLPAESGGIFHPVKDWSLVSQAYLSIGHEISSTPLQVLRAVSAVANKGRIVQPYIVEAVVDSDGTVHDKRPKQEPIQVIEPETAERLAMALRGVVREGTAKAAQIPGVEVFGKTGTAQRIESGKRYSRDSFNASFVGFFPAEAPRYGIIVVVHNPKGRKKDGGVVAAPIFGEIGKQIMVYEAGGGSDRKLVVSGSTPDWGVDAGPAPDASNGMPDLRGLRLRNLYYQCNLLGIQPEIDGDGKVIEQWPAPGEPIPDNMSCKVLLGDG